MPGDVICLSHLRWGFVFQRPNHLMSRCARHRRVFFVEEPIFDAREPQLTFERADSGVHVVVPHVPPNSSPEEIVRVQRDLLDELRLERLVHEPILWLYTPMALAITEHIRRSATVYDCMDELSGFHGAPRVLRDQERRLFGVADLVFTGGQSLYEAKRAHHPNVHAFPSSVDAKHFAKARTHAQLTEPPDQRAIPHPRLGFFGVVDERMDHALLREAAELRPDLQFVMLGPVVKIDPAVLPRLPNIHYLGQKTYTELPAYLAFWDVAIMPFALNEATRYISPTKTLEYLAAGKPVVSTPIHDVVRPYGEQGLVRIADGADALVRAAQAALDERGTHEAERRRQRCDAFVAQTSWDRTWTRMHQLLRDVVTRRSTPREQEEGGCSTISS